MSQVRAESQRASRQLRAIVEQSVRGSSRASGTWSAVVLGCAFFGSGIASAQDARSAAEVQAEVTRLRQLLEKEEQVLAQKASGAPASSSPNPAATAAQAKPHEAKQQDDRLDKVVVRSRNRLEPLQDVPLSISVVTGKELERLQALDIGSITQRAANVAWNFGNQRTSSLSVRGVGKQGQTEAQDPSVGIIVDGVNYAYNALTSSYDFYDVDTVEVTRGPQGTLLGKNTSLGVVNVTTRRPSFKPDANFSLTFGEWDTVLGRAAGGGPIVDDLLAWRGTLSINKGQGDIKNEYNRDITWINRDRASGRLQFLLTPTENFSARLAVDSQPRGGETYNARTINTPRPLLYANGTPNTSLDNRDRLKRRWFTQLGSYTYEGDYLHGGGDNEVNYDYARPLVTGSNGASLDWNWNLGAFDLTSITAYKDYHFNAVNDEGTPFDVYRNAGGFWNDYKQFSQELRLSSQLGGFADYQTGLYFIKVHNTADYRRQWGNDAGAWFATTPQYNRLDTDGNGRYLMQNSLDGLLMSFNSPAGTQDIRNKSAAAFGQVNWHFSEAFTLTTGLRLTREDRKNRASTFIKDNGFAPELNPSIVNGVNLGGFDAFSNTGAARWVLNGVVVPAGTAGATLVGAGTAAAPTVALTTDTSNAALLAQANAQANTVASKYFGVATWAALTAAQQRQVADAQAIRRTAIGVVFNQADAEPFKDTQKSFVVSPSYKFSDAFTGYLSWQYGEKAGISQFTNGISNLIGGEKTSAYELGLKSVLLDNSLVFNTAIFLMDIDDYQQGVRIVDVYTTASANDGEIRYTTATGNVPKVEVKGVEIDGVFSGLRNTTLRFAGAYNDATYKKFPNSAQPTENGFTGAPPYQDVSGENLPGASKWAFNVGIDHHLPVFNDKEIRTSANAAYSSRYNSDNSLSSYSWVGAKTIVDLAIGVGTRSGSFDVSLLAKNLFNDNTPLGITSTGYTPAIPRWYGVAVTGKL